MRELIHKLEEQDLDAEVWLDFPDVHDADGPLASLEAAAVWESLAGHGRFAMSESADPSQRFWRRLGKAVILSGGAA